MKAQDQIDEAYGDCDEEGFCEEWMAARTDIVLATILDGVIFLLLLAFFIGGNSLRKDHWKLITGLIILDFVALIFHAYKNSEKFIYGYRLDTSFYLASLAAVLNLTNGVGFIVYSVFLQPKEEQLSNDANNDNGYEPINQSDEDDIEFNRPVPLDQQHVL
ncbi:12299_t:CDS:2 [Entrophospora sp. SA101]|nr:12299_t:CDS:2 [Entrophospora sp. SA101]